METGFSGFCAGFSVAPFKTSLEEWKHVLKGDKFEILLSF